MPPEGREAALSAGVAFQAAGEAEAAEAAVGSDAAREAEPGTVSLDAAGEAAVRLFAHVRDSTFSSRKAPTSTTRATIPAV
jgi:hypothetical protein